MENLDDRQKGAAPEPSSGACAPAPPEPPQLSRDFDELAQAAAEVRAQEASRAHAAKRRRIAALGIAIAGVALILAGALGTFVLFHAPEATDASSASQAGVSQQTASDATANEEGGSSQGESSADGAEGESVSAVEAVVAKDQISAAFSSLSSDENGLFTSYVTSFMEDYDAGVSSSVSYTFADLGIEAEDLSAALRTDFSCEVVSVDVQGKTAWVSLNVSSKSLADQADAFAKSVESGASSAQDEESYKAFLKQAYLDAFSGVSARSHELLVTIERGEGKWTVTDDAFEYILGTVWYTSA